MGKDRRRDAGWDHAIKIDESRFKTKCKWCGHVMSSGGVTRLKIHLAGVGGNATACTGCPNEVRLAMKELVRGVQTSCSKSKPKSVEPNFDHNYDAAQLPDGNSIEDDERGEIKMPACQTPEAIRILSSFDIPYSNNQSSRLRVAYQGAPGAYSEEVAEKAYANCEAIPYEQFQSTFDAVERWLADRAIVPIENSLGGSIHRNYDLLLHHKLEIVGEVYHSVRYCLLANHGVEVADLKRVLSHPHAFAQCENVLMKLGVSRETVDDDAIAAQFIAAQKFQDVGAIASSRAAELYGLNILAHDIQDEPDNITRFLMLAREPVVSSSDGPFKTSIVFHLDEGPNALFKAVAVFATRQINIAKIESQPLWKRPRRKQNGGNNNGLLRCSEYRYYLDFNASMADPIAQNALRNLKEFAMSVRVLGSYPKWLQ